MNLLVLKLGTYKISHQWNLMKSQLQESAQ